MTPGKAPVPQGSNALERAREELLDLSNRSRLLNSKPQGRGNQLRIVGERSSVLFDRLVGEGGHFGFLPAEPRAPGDPTGAGSVDGHAVDATVESTADSADGDLQTALEESDLAKRLLRMASEDRTIREEEGVGVLHLALGFLTWHERDEPSTPRRAPLVLVPVALERSSAAMPFRLRPTGDELPENLSLAAKLKRDFAVELPGPPDGESDDVGLSLEAHFDAVEKAISGRPGWSVERNEVLLAFFSFSRFLMWRDLDAANWPKDLDPSCRPDGHPLIAGLLTRSFPPSSPPLCDDEAPLDPLLPPESTIHVVDSDASQAQVVAEAIELRRSLVVQGPPGTGKSQTIANIIAAAVAKGLRVLFVAEKLAALTVVRRRLETIGLASACLELHSTKATRRSVLDDLARTIDLGSPKVGDVKTTCARLRSTRDQLWSFAERLHRVDPRSGMSPFDAVAELCRLRAFDAGPALELAESTTWSEADVALRTAELSGLAGILGDTAGPADHPWRGVGLTAILPSDFGRIASEAESIVAAIKALQPLREALGTALGPRVKSIDSLDELAIAHRAARWIAQRPPCDRAALSADIWERSPQECASLGASVADAATQRERLQAMVTPGALEADHTALRESLATHGTAWIRAILPGWRRADRAYRAIVRGVPSRELSPRLALLDDIAALQRAEAAIARSEQVGRAAFGSMWVGRASDPAALAAISSWMAACPAPVRTLRSIASGIETIVPQESAELDRAAETLTAARQVIESVLQRWMFDPAHGFGSATLGAIPIAALQERAEVWRRTPEAIRWWIDWSGRERTLRGYGLGALVDAISAGSIQADQASDALRHARAVAVFRAADPDGSLSRFDGRSYEQRATEFCGLDEARIRAARVEVAAAHHQRVPRPEHGLGQVAIILRECAKERRHLPIRRLLGSAGDAVQAIKPVLMMSPLSVAQYLEPGRLQFDLLVVDEASQVRPVEALGAVARLHPSATMVVVGDDRQLPPTAFFRRVEGESLGEHEEEEAIADLESLLGACEAAGIPRRMLRWHYRSKHHSLITLSNRLFYDHRLYVVPSPATADSRLGLRLHHVEGVYDRGKTRTNRLEAETCARAVMEHASRTPGLSLGVAAFSVQQRDAIIDALESLRRADPSREEFFAEDGAEPFFIKNLESVQGDERDVIFISVGYARDESGQLTMNFGPISAEGGERRLNVLITRAKSRCEVFSSLAAEDIDTTRATGVGPRALKAFLAYAARGDLDGEVSSTDRAGREPGSGVRGSIRDALEREGCTIDEHIGAAGCVVDLAVRDPERPNSHVLGIEIDGEAWRATRTTRDRERTRPSVLTARGWNMVRVHALDWYLRRTDTLERLRGAIADANLKRSTMDAGDAPESTRGSGGTNPVGETIERVDAARTRQAYPPYQVAQVTVVGSRKPGGVTASACKDIVSKVLAAEAPIHEAELARRVASAFGQTRVSPTITALVSTALRELIARGRVQLDGSFLELSGCSTPPIRDRRNAPASVRDALMLPTSELIALLRAIASAQIGVRRDELIVEARRQLGYASTSAKLRGVIEAALDRGIASGVLVERGGAVFGGESA